MIKPFTHSCRQLANFLFPAILLMAVTSVAQITWPSGQLLPSFPAPAKNQDLIYIRENSSRWEAEGSSISHNTGHNDGDGWLCQTGVDAANNHMVYGPYDKTIPSGPNKADFRIKIDNNTANNDPIVDLDVRDATNGAILASQAVTRQQFSVAGDYVTFTLPFTMPADNHSLELRVYWRGNSYTKVDYVGVQQNSSTPEMYLFSSLKGIINRTQPRIFSYEGDAFAEGQYTWLQSLGLTWTEYSNNWDLITKYRNEINGLIVYDPAQTATINLATILAKDKKALIASPALLTRLTSAPYNLPILQDLRGQYSSKLQVYQTIFNTYWPSLDHRLVIGLNPDVHKAALREYAVATGLATIWLDPDVSGESELLNQFLASMPAGSNFMGWWPNEQPGVQRTSQYGITTIASDWSCNLTMHSGMPRTINVKPIPPKPTLQNKIYVAFILSDGDNLQYVEHLMRKLWNNPDRGSVPMGWTVSPAMVDAMPGALNFYHQTATNNDNLISGPSGYGYTYPNSWPNQNALNQFAAKTEEYNRIAGLRVVTVWNTIVGGINQNVGQTYASYAPSLLGVTAQNTGGGLTIYNNSLPGMALSCNYCTGEQAMKDAIASAANGWNRNEPRFIIIQAQPWTDIRPTSFKNVANSLNSDYVVVRPDHIFQLIREKNGLPIDPNPINGTGDGLTASYYNGMNFETPALSKKDANLSMDWGSGSPGAGVNADGFSARWTGQIQPRYSGEYTFYINSDNGRRVWVNNQLIIDKWVDDWNVEYSGKITLTAGQKYDIKVEYFENFGGANIKFEWSSASQAREIVPTSQLYSNPTPTVSITSPANNTSFTAPATVTINANAGDNGSVAKVDFYNGTTLLGSDNTSPYSYGWTNIAEGAYSLKAVVTDNSGAFTISSPVSINVTVSVDAPAAPSNLTAKTYSNSQINLKWNDNSSDETGFSIAIKKGVNGSYAEVAKVAAGVTSYNVTGLTSLTSYFFKVKALKSSVSSAYSNEAIAATTSASWSKATSPIWTIWGEGINDPTNVLQEYPRPQMVKENWQNLNGLWDVWEGEDINFTGSKKGILVPYPIQSALSGIKQNWHNFTYEKYIGIPQDWNGKRVLLHFGAVDFQAEIFINGQSVLLHKGGYDPFYVDITDKVAAGNTYRLNVKVYDVNDSNGYPGPQGKQADDRFNVAPFGINYTPTSGIWQTVWMEAVPQVYISDVKMVPNIDNGTLQLTITTTGSASGVTVEAQAKDGSTVVSTSTGAANSTITLSIPNQKLWSPSSPFLYDLNLTLKNGTTTIESLQSYFGMRKISLGKEDGKTKMFLNNQFLFQMGPLDQGFWPDGIYTPPSEAAILFDLQGIKGLGYNMVRKHIKVEPARWYYNADKLGLLVWQDMVNGNNSTQVQRDQFKLELERMIKTHYNYPSIIMWVTFNEQWGMFDPVPIANYAQSLDPSRLINENSACCSAPYSTVGHVKDYHHYSDPSSPTPDDNRALSNGEYGGVVLRKPGNMWNDNAWSDWAKVISTDDEFTTAVNDYANVIRDLKVYRGMSAAVFTQWTDVEAEINGHYTYDRKVLKGNASTIKTALESTYNNSIPYVNPPSGFAVFESYNISGNFIRHQNSRGRIDNVIAPIEDSYWKMVPGLAGAGVSFQSLKFPDQYLRHANGELVLAVNDGTQLFKEDASFYQRPGLANASLVSFESYNFQGRYIRHRNSLLYSEAVTDQLGHEDATFFVYGGSVVSGAGDGLMANYFNGMNFETPKYSRKDATISFDWGSGSPDASVNADAFSARWTGQIQPKYSETYTFYVNSDNGRRLWINNQLIIDKWIDDWGVEYTGTIALAAGQKYDIKLEYFENYGGAGCKLEWSSASQSRQVVPQSQLYSNTLPVVAITSPANNSSSNAPANLNLTVNASDGDESVANVNYYNGATLIASTSAPFTYAWNNVPAGTYSITAMARDNRGGVSVSAPVSVTIKTSGNQSPTVAITSPANNSSYNAPASITLSANASDSDGSISKVEFFNGSQSIGFVTASPYNFTWTNVAAGTYTITAKATDNANAITTSSAITVVVKSVNTNTCSGIPQYVENSGYVDGSKVQNGGSSYQCKPYPYSGWCNGAAWAYAPGTGAYWTDAWALIGSCTASAATVAASNVLVPNPATDNLTINIGENSKVTIYNSMGNVAIPTINVSAYGSLNIAPLAGGIYDVRIETPLQIINVRLVKD